MTPDFFQALISPKQWTMVIATVLLVGASVALHYEALEQLNRRMPYWDLARHPRILVMILNILAVHVFEIWVFGIGAYLMLQHPQFGEIVGMESIKLLDAIYLSATTYTTVGYGDLSPTGSIRFLYGSESLTGLVLITWSASFTYLEMGRFWRN